MDLIKLQPGGVGEQHLDRLEAGIHRAIAGGMNREFHPADHHGQIGGLRPLGATNDAQMGDLHVIIHRVAAGVLHQGDQVIVIDFLFAVGQSLEPHEHVVQLVVGKVIAQIGQL